MSRSHFPADFVWGVAAASYQIEGAAYEGLKRPSVWDEFCRKEGVIANNDSGEVACDHFHRYEEDIAIMSSLGYPTYRFSINWPRVIPKGTGQVYADGLDFYDRLVDTLLSKNITPYVTLFHWEFPQALQDKGGWLHPDSPKWFAEYTRVIVDKLSDRVRNWITLNEPQCFILLGHYEGTHAPGLKMPVKEILAIAHNVFLAHGESVKVIREEAKTLSRIGLAMIGRTFIPHSLSPQDIEAARQAIFDFDGMEHGLWSNGLWFDPMLLGRYPEGYYSTFGDLVPAIGPDDFEVMAQPIDFLGLNIYQAPFVRMGPDGKPEMVPLKTGAPRANNGWPVTPQSLYWGPRFHYERYRIPIYITENGLANQDWVSLDGRVHDPQRIDYLRRYLLELDRAIADGTGVKGYFQWSILDNFEWAEGYDKRFGLVYVDFETLKRTVKDSAYWYSNVIKTNGEALYEGL
ncbi:MAG TPA: GH1 family beta-glucosidase [Thermoclostridium sp.]|nr:GH1 family beta-glucosidase [Thermoclostridium sp.]HPU45011.1 GH1 family beta-glucosidase [Thermoclostridium sp.]